MAKQRSSEGDDSKANWPVPRSAAFDAARDVKSKVEKTRSGESEGRASGG